MSFSITHPTGKNPNAESSKIVNAATGETAPALPRWERNNKFVDYAAPKRIVQETGTQYGRICPQCGEPSVVGAEQMRVLSLFWVLPVWPLGSKNIWGCGRCGWRQVRGQGPDPKEQEVAEGHQPIALEEDDFRRAAEFMQSKKGEPSSQHPPAYPTQ